MMARCVRRSGTSGSGCGLGPGRVALLLLVAAAFVPLAVGGGHDQAVGDRPQTTPARRRARLDLGEARVRVRVPPGPGRQGGAEHAGDWIRGSTFDLTAKAVVDGRVRWSGKVGFAVRRGTLVITGNGLPHRRRPGASRSRRATTPTRTTATRTRSRPRRSRSRCRRHPSSRAKPSCVPMGMIGIAINGVDAVQRARRRAAATRPPTRCRTPATATRRLRGSYHYHRSRRA